MDAMSSLDLTALDRDGWIAVPGVVADAAATELARRCQALLEGGDEPRQGDKPAGGTRRAAALRDRLPAVDEIFDHADIRVAVEHLLGRAAPLTDVAFRSPQPGFGRQSLHTDDVPTSRADESRAVTCIVALCAFGRDNGATAVIPGSHRRPDQQRRPDRLGPGGQEVVLVGPAGTAFVFSAHLLHRGTRNCSHAPRPALQAQWRMGPTPGGVTLSRLGCRA